MEKQATIYVTKHEIADSLGISYRTLIRRMHETGIFEMFRNNRLISVAEKAFIIKTCFKDKVPDN